jgi:HNH endonuclease
MEDASPELCYGGRSYHYVGHCKHHCSCRYHPYAPVPPQPVPFSFYPPPAAAAAAIPIYPPTPFFPSSHSSSSSRRTPELNRKNKNRKSLSDCKRLAVWNTYIGKEVYKHLCIVCNDRMMEKSERVYDCGHVIPVAHGGSDDIDNLRPVCHSCNIRMATKNMVKYMEEMGLDKQNPMGYKIVKNNIENVPPVPPVPPVHDTQQIVPAPPSVPLTEGRSLRFRVNHPCYTGRKRDLSEDSYRESDDESSDESDNEKEPGVETCRAIQKNGLPCKNASKYEGFCGLHFRK